MTIRPLNIFYEEPDPDRWINFDRYPRRLIRRLVRGKQRPGGVGTIAINLLKGFDKLNIPYRLNDYKYIKEHPEEIACIIGKPHVLFDKNWKNDIIFGAGIYSHPIECPDLLIKYPNVKRFLVPGEWMKNMFEPFYHDKVLSWAVGIDTEVWSPQLKLVPETDFLIYDKIRWEHDKYKADIIDPICKSIDEKSLTYSFIRYGTYSHEELKHKLGQAKAVIFLCEHETQGLAYQQILATGIPILAWDRGGYWQDLYYYPDKVKYQPVSSVPYWDDRCGMKFTNADDFKKELTVFLTRLDEFKPRDYIMENLTLESAAQAYLEIVKQVENEVK